MRCHFVSKEDLTYKMTLEQKPEGSEGEFMGIPGAGESLAERPAGTKHLGTGRKSLCLQASKQGGPSWR